MRVRLGLVLGVLLGCGLPLAADVLYSVTDLGTLGGDHTYAYALNNAGQVTGSSEIRTTGPGHAFLYTDGQMQDLGTLGGATSVGLGINNAGQVTGSSNPPFALFGTANPFLYSNGQMSAIGGQFTYGSGQGINNAGQIAGILGINSGFPTQAFSTAMAS